MKFQVFDFVTPMLDPEKNEEYCYSIVLLIMIFIFFPPFVPLGFLPWEIWAIFPGESQL